MKIPHLGSLASQKLPKAPLVAGNLCGCSSKFGLLLNPVHCLAPMSARWANFCSPGVLPMSGFQGGDLLRGRIV